jgi:hypothetical protein
MELLARSLAADVVQKTPQKIFFQYKQAEETGISETAHTSRISSSSVFFLSVECEKLFFDRYIVAFQKTPPDSSGTSPIC